MKSSGAPPLTRDCNGLGLLERTLTEDKSNKIFIQQNVILLFISETTLPTEAVKYADSFSADR